MVLLQNNLELDRCPHCSVAKPNLRAMQQMETNNHAGNNRRIWFIYKCSSCGGIVTAWSVTQGGVCQEIFPSSREVERDIPDRAKSYLQQAIASIHAPAGAVMLAASSVDAMLKTKGYSDGSLYKRIEKAVEDNLITQNMAAWAHDVRLDANDQRHADGEAELPSTDDASRAIDFTVAFAEYLFVLPSKIQRGMAHE